MDNNKMEIIDLKKSIESRIVLTKIIESLKKNATPYVDLNDVEIIELPIDKIRLEYLSYSGRYDNMINGFYIFRTDFHKSKIYYSPPNWSTFLHETGHHVVENLRLEILMDIRDHYCSIRFNQSKFFREHGTKNFKEMFADGFSCYIQDPQFLSNVDYKLFEIVDSLFL